MRGLSAIGLTVGVVMMTAPLWLPRLGIGGLGLSLSAPPAASAPRVAPSRSGGGGPSTDAIAGIMAAMEKAGGMVGAPSGLAPDLGSPVASMHPATDPAAAMASVCDAMARAGHMTKDKCKAELGGAFDPTGGPQGMGEVERAMQGNRTFGTVKPTKKNPGAKFVRVEK